MFKLKKGERTIVGNYFTYGTLVYKIVRENLDSGYLNLAYCDGDTVRCMPTSITRRIYFDGLKDKDYYSVSEEEVLQPNLKAFKLP